ncbi:hypothetical protein SAM19_04637 [Brevibacillus laterosporus]|nr:hypothetical protein [Brevibacillus laterosporus]
MEGLFCALPCLVVFFPQLIERDLFTYYAGFITLGILAAIGSYFLRNARIRM